MKARWVVRLIPLVLIGMAAFPGQALAHAVQTNYLLNSSQQLEVQTTFSTGEPLKGAKVQIYAPNNPNRPWAQGVTDAQGRFQFSPDKQLAGNWEITIGQQGHSDILTVPVDQSGIEADLISQGPKQDVHYGSPSLLGSLVMTLAAVGGFLWAKRGRRYRVLR